MTAWDYVDEDVDGAVSAGERGAHSPLPSSDGATLPEKFNRNSNLALDRAAEIMRLPLDQQDRNFGAVIRAVASTVNAQIGAQLRVDEMAVKARQNDDLSDLLYKFQLTRMAMAARAGEGIDRAEAQDLVIKLGAAGGSLGRGAINTLCDAGVEVPEALIKQD